MSVLACPGKDTGSRTVQAYAVVLYRVPLLGPRLGSIHTLTTGFPFLPSPSSWRTLAKPTCFEELLVLYENSVPQISLFG